ncbi:c-1-tetrahydrofolate synthase cytoplasmic-related [Holotrichia oblita]|nr:c-1-tetrahydrofolate synthase cytoplasmic-related [Holotrichia oblita]
MATIIDGKALADDIKKEIAAEIKGIKEKINFTAVLVGENPASLIYIDKKKKACAEVGINMNTVTLPKIITQKDLENTLKKLSADKKTHGILVQLPLPGQINVREAIECIHPHKDVDGLTVTNFGRLALDPPALVPCTALGVLHIIKSSKVSLPGAEVVVVGRSNIVGKPVAMLLQRENATVTICHKGTRDIAAYTQKADIIVAAVGSANMITAAMVKYGAVVIDVGINRQPNGKIVGDVDYDEVAKKASVITPVPGGVGPLTIACLLQNILSAYKMQTNT